jgi:hypothetical protein
VIDSPTENLENPDKLEKRRNRTSGKHPLARLTGRHFLAENEDKKYRPDCTACSDWKHACVQTTFYCKQCNVPLCKPPKDCFESYHTQLNYRH